MVSEAIPFPVLTGASSLALEMILRALIAICTASVSIPSTLNLMPTFYVTNVATCYGYSTRMGTYAALCR